VASAVSATVSSSFSIANAPVLNDLLQRTVDHLDFSGKNFYHQLSMAIENKSAAWSEVLPDAGYSVGEWTVSTALRLDGDDLLRPLKGPTHVAPVPDGSLLTGFIGLETATSEEIFEFAMRWGTLGICEHGLPSTHSQQLKRPSFDYPYCPLRPEGGEEGVLREPLIAWRNLAGSFEAIASIASRVLRNEPGHLEDWERLLLSQPVGIAAHDASFIPARDAAHQYFDDVQRAPLVESLETILVMADLRPSIRWRRGNPSPEFDLVPGSLFAALVMELMYEVTGSDPMFHCSACGRLYKPARRPRTAERHYCPRCRREGKPQRYAEQRRAERARRRTNRGDSP
jgi:hypothetical protein